ncbi:MAG: bifunctional folylpolyglutamate synthase/dihydrofolate synthase [Lachnospiraceae bacterium]|nr:bifunctional folylpolyglutamate synthase/dihydrofolate synthase [Lachnospiraceae bacterium]
MTYQECVEYVLSIPLFAAKLGTDNLNKILDIMNHPERDCLVIHVAGTNGKGSTCLFLASILEKTGYRVGVFASPHLVSLNERIRINDSIISDEDFVDSFEEVMEYISVAEKQGIAHPSFFEFVFLMACIYFKKQRVDYAVFETGMGGRLDATNVVEPVLSIITSIGRDHTQFLGDTIEQIAGEKAGIIKAGVPVLYFDRKDAATAVIRDYAAKIGSKLQLVEKKQYKISKITEKTIDFLFDSGYYRYSSLQIKKTGLYQIENAILAVKAYELLFNMTYRCCDQQSCLVSEQGTLDINSVSGTDTIGKTGYRLTDIYYNIKAGLLSMTWPCRMQEVAPHIYIDGAHNEEAIEAFCKTLEELFPKERKILLFAVSKDKEYESMIQRLSEIFFEEIIIVRYDGDRAADLSAVEVAFRRFSGSKITVYDNIRAGFTYARSHVGEQYLFCVGSLYLAGDLLTLGV